MSNDDYTDDDAYTPTKLSSGGLIPSAGGLAAILAVLAWLVLLLGIIQVTITLTVANQNGNSGSVKVIIYDVTQIWSALAWWGVLMLGAVIARAVSRRDED
jgi:vacuolar-type H+-ATPase subunit I/STV1